MPAISSVFLVIALVLAVVMGPQTRPWTWGPAMLALGISVSAAVPVFWKRSRLNADFGMLVLGTLVAGWFAWRAWSSPVAELGLADLMLLSGAVGTFTSIRAIEGNAAAERILLWGIALLLAANVVVVGKQLVDPTYTPVFVSRAGEFPSGFYAHYNEAANYLIASSLLVAAAALFGRQGSATRIVWGLIAAGGLAAVYFTRSRGGIVGAALGVGVFAVVSLMIGHRQKARWFAPALIAIPLIGLAIGGYLVMGLEDSQELRRAGSGIAGMWDNNSRLFLLGIAMSCIGLHPLAGGGSRSFSWESFRFFEGKLQGGIITHLPEQTHNELIQAATDYGLIGAGLLIVLLATLVVSAVVRILFPESPEDSDGSDVWRLGGLAALAGMFVQSCFSFVFHLLPGVVLLGICLGAICRPSARRGRLPLVTGSRILLSVAAVTCLILLFPLGWKGTQVTRILWSSFLSKVPPASDEARIDALTEAIRLWPQSTFFMERAMIHQTSPADAGIKESTERAIRDYEQAERIHPHDPGPAINRANLLSQLHRDPDAEAAYERAIQLQGGMEPAFRAHFSLANHLMAKGHRQFKAENPAATLATLETAARQMEESVGMMHWVIPDMSDPRVAVHESLGAAREASGDYQGALQAYDFAATLPNGSRVNFRAGIVIRKMADVLWKSRHPSEALGYFIEAKRRVEMASELPGDITPEQRLEYFAYLDKMIAFLKEAKVEPTAFPVK
ncbi:MAG: O-antigen ligase family protein [Verrucomicrobiota bacterium]